VTVGLLVAAALVAALDWVAVDQRFFRIEYVAKPLTLALLVAAAATGTLGAPGPWVVAALACGLVGDIALLAADEHSAAVQPPFVAGLAAFLVGHACYVVAFLRAGVSGLDLLAGALVAAGIATLALPAVLRGAARAAGTQFAAVVAVYAAALAAVAALGVGTGSVITAVGAQLFLVSDVVLAREKFVARVPRGPLAVAVTYHLGQGLILIGLLHAAS